jgi:hypothetical protein
MCFARLEQGSRAEPLDSVQRKTLFKPSLEGLARGKRNRRQMLTQIDQRRVSLLHKHPGQAFDVCPGLGGGI